MARGRQASCHLKEERNRHPANGSNPRDQRQHLPLGSHPLCRLAATRFGLDRWGSCSASARSATANPHRDRDRVGQRCNRIRTTA